jgi:glycosyltransferase involved in cell wall biosynthesis
LESLQKKVPDALSKQIIFTGKRDDIESILQIIDIGALITNAENHGEGISNSIIECMTMGKPVIATRGGGTNEVVLDGFNGFLVGHKNEEQIIAAIEKLVKDSVLLHTMGENARQYVRKNFDLEQKTDEYIRLYQKLAPKANK